MDELNHFSSQMLPLGEAESFSTLNHRLARHGRLNHFDPIPIQRLGSRRYDANGWFFLSVWYRNVPKTWQLQCFPVLLEIIPSFMWDSPTAIDIHKPYHDWGWLISTIYRTHKHMMIVVMTWGLSNWLQTWVYHGLPHAFPCYTAHKHMVMTWGWLISAPPTIRPR